LLWLSQEIEKLNRECLDFEEQTAALKLEVKEAWDNYKTAQEKSAAVESELQDEVRQIQKAKLLDKQQSVAQLGKMNEEVAEAMRQVQVAQAQRAELQSRLDAAAEESAQWEERLLAAQRELAEAKTGTVQGVAALREELRLAQVSAEQMRSDHSALVRQHQLRQADLERENAELVASVTQQQKELQRLQHQSSNNTGLFAANSSLENSDYITLQQELITLTGKYESEKDKFEELDRKVKITEREARAAQMNAEEERKRSAGTIDALSAKVAELESKLNSRKLQPAGFASGSGFLPSSAQGEVGGNGNDHGGEKHAESGDAGEGGAGGIPMHRAQSGFTLGDYEQVVRELAEHKAQSQNLSKLLLKKQGAVLELQAERSALKSRLIDMQARYVVALQFLCHVPQEDWWIALIHVGSPVHTFLC
jgi:chromosome segregation ATPase